MPGVPSRPPALLVSEVFPPQIGGSGEFLYNVYGRFEDVPVMVLCEGRPEEGQRNGGVQTVRRSMRRAQWGIAHPAGALGHLKGLAAILSLVRSSAPDVIHAGRILPEGFDAWMAARLTRRPFLSWVHGEEIACQADSRELRTLLTVALRNADAIVANSQSTARAVLDIGVARDRVKVVYPGVDASRFRPDVPGCRELRQSLAGPDELLLLTVGRLQRRKGHDLVLRALSGLIATMPIRYVIVGEGTEGPRLHQMAHDLGLDAHVHFVGAVAPESLPAYYAAADCFVHPNRVDGRDVEGFGIVFLEAAAAGLPVVAGRSGGAPEAVLADRTGLLVSGTDVEELQSAIRRLAAQPALRTALGAAGRERVVREFSWENAAASVLALHLELSRRRT